MTYENIGGGKFGFLNTSSFVCLSSLLVFFLIRAKDFNTILFGT
jgi:hypothetical protein